MFRNGRKKKILQNTHEDLKSKTSQREVDLNASNSNKEDETNTVLTTDGGNKNASTGKSLADDSATIVEFMPINSRFTDPNDERWSTSLNGRTETSLFSNYGPRNANAPTFGGISLGSMDGGLPSLSIYEEMLQRRDLMDNELITERRKRRVPAKLKPGFLYLLNHDEFVDSEHNRKGSLKDVQAIRETFEKKFQLKTNYCPNYTVDQIKSLAERIQEKDFTEHSCVVVVILSHGSRHEIIHAFDGPYNIHDDIFIPMLHNETLNGKPKFFFVQACKGDLSINIQSDAKGTLQAPAEIFKFYSTVEGFLSYRYEETGSIFMQLLCKNLNESGFTKDIEEIAKDVIKEVNENYSQFGQVPMVTVNLTKPYTFGDYVVPHKPTSSAVVAT